MGEKTNEGKENFFIIFFSKEKKKLEFASAKGVAYSSSVLFGQNTINVFDFLFLFFHFLGIQLRLVAKKPEYIRGFFLLKIGFADLLR